MPQSFIVSDAVDTGEIKIGRLKMQYEFVVYELTGLIDRIYVATSEDLVARFPWLKSLVDTRILSHINVEIGDLHIEIKAYNPSPY